jgi:hypothetical protein
MNDTKVIGSLIKITFYVQNTNEDAWREVSKERNRNSPEKTTPRKQSKMNRYRVNISLPTTNSFEELKEDLDDTTIKVRMEEIVKSSLIFIAGIFSLSQLLKEIAIGKYKIKIINNEQVKIQPNSFIVSITRKFKSRNTEFHTYKPKQEKSFKVVFKNIYVIANLNDIRKEIEDLEYTITNI